ncbi:hypothetical protein RS86_01102 [Microbacterium azadirachtae]|uniref:Uncharacterized protein n=1 Tax=Microbacterium azadirachtae TaxID=582680 RepID=A0A0F0LPX3_9MICO|nr:hypothetical protein RS86_01102 [Microbacterium azadirachtae]
MLLIVALALGAVVSLLGAIGLLIPGILPTGASPSLVATAVGAPMAAAVSIAAGLAAVAVGVLGLRGQRGGGAGDVVGAAPGGLRIAAVIAALLVAALIPGGIIPVAGYSFVLVVAGLVVVGLVLLTVRRPVIGVIGIALVVGVVVLAALRLPLTTFAPRVLDALAPRLGELAVSFAHLVAAGALAAWAIGEPAVRGRFAAGVRRHRRAVTAAAALCALPYVFCRLTWLTPWPLFAPTGALAPDILMVGLLLGGAMLAAGLLTLALCLPWADRFPQWMGGVGGRPVPAGLVVVAASFVAVMFTVGGVDLVRVAATSGGALAVGVLELLLVLPFWLWGPLLALATWGYAMHRGRLDERLAAPRAIGDRGLSDTLRARATAELDAIEEREVHRSVR